jgi:cell division septum initiation protein DivIVA
MSAATSITTGAQIRGEDLPRGFRGFDEDATRSFLEAVANAFDGLRSERDRLLKDLEDRPSPPDPDTPSAESIGNALLAANRAAEDLIAEATDKASQIVAEAETEAERVSEQTRTATAQAKRETDAERAKLDEERRGLQTERDQWQQQVESERARLLAEARAEAEEIVGSAQANVVGLRTEAAELQAWTTAKRQEFIDLIRAMLERLDELDVEAIANGDQRQILADLRPTTDGDAALPDALVSSSPDQ